MKVMHLLTITTVIAALLIAKDSEAQTQLTLVKEVVGGEAAVTDWVLTADGTGSNDLSGAGFISGLVAPDTFNLSESAGPPGYTAGDWNCEGGGSLDGQSLTLSEDENVTCTIVNTFTPPVVVFDTDLALPAMPTGDGAGIPVCIDETSGLLVAGCDVTITADEIDPASVQRRVSDACAQGFLIRAVNEDGSVVCEPDSDTTLSEGEVDAFVANNGYSTGPHTVDTTLSEGEVDAFVANNGYATAGVATDTSGSTTYLTASCSNYDNSVLSITVPKAGTILVEAQVVVQATHTLGTDNVIVLAIGTSPTDCSSGFYQAKWEIPSEWPSASFIDNTLNLSRPFNVPSAGTYTYYLNGYMQSGYAASTDTFYWSHMVATFHD